MLQIEIFCQTALAFYRVTQDHFMYNLETKINARSSPGIGLKEVWQEKELLFFFVWRDVKVKYKHAVLGILWTILQPLLLSFICFFVFQRSLRVATGSVDISSLFSGLVFWGLFSSALTGSSESILSNSAIVKKIFFPRLLLPLSAILAAVVDFVVAFFILTIFLLVEQRHVTWHILWCGPVALFITLIYVIGFGSLLSALNLKYRDFRYLLPFILQLLFFCSQIVYLLDGLDNPMLRLLLYCNPLNGALEIFYFSLGFTELDSVGILISLAFAFFILALGLIQFAKTERYIADTL